MEETICVVGIEGFLIYGGEDGCVGKVKVGANREGGVWLGGACFPFWAWFKFGLTMFRKRLMGNTCWV